MDGKEFWLWLAIGLLPYSIEKAHRPGGRRVLEVQALFWRLTVRRRRHGRTDWQIHIPLIERLRDAVWAAVLRLKERDETEV